MVQDMLPKEDALFILDTNVLLSNLDLVPTLLHEGSRSARFVLPLSVLMELDGLKGQGSSELSEMAGEAVELVEMESSLGRAQSPLRIITSQGAIMSSLKFRVEHFYNADRGIYKVDDVLVHLATLLPTIPEGEGREAVIVTEDTNLRLKARTRGARVLSVNQLTEWMRRGRIS